MEGGTYEDKLTLCERTRSPSFLRFLVWQKGVIWWIYNIRYESCNTFFELVELPSSWPRQTSSWQGHSLYRAARRLAFWQVPKYHASWPEHERKGVREKKDDFPGKRNRLGRSNLFPTHHHPLVAGHIATSHLIAVHVGRSSSISTRHLCLFKHFKISLYTAMSYN